MASDTPTNKRIRLRIPKDYHQEPVISRLVSDYNLTVNITAAILGANAVGDGWFDLELKGTEAQTRISHKDIKKRGQKLRKCI
ncbi:NIL domain-containing protein [Nostoc paludosum FACHB-159]|uniref:NIL domain-containing protein n=1 Tax=Nostoc paludosum FACHB-159 TaxID=2692908 RepID=A0ABR8K3H4_9NOSO|nr:NIL domain-containing protein [Nostoc paludosum]MBD2733329.1 NIL domain-containing protein [Nostoc paludosum FACHB-159]